MCARSIREITDATGGQQPSSRSSSRASTRARRRCPAGCRGHRPLAIAVAVPGRVEQDSDGMGEQAPVLRVAAQGSSTCPGAAAPSSRESSPLGLGSREPEAVSPILPTVTWWGRGQIVAQGRIGDDLAPSPADRVHALTAPVSTVIPSSECLNPCNEAGLGVWRHRQQTPSANPAVVSNQVRSNRRMRRVSHFQHTATLPKLPRR
jgi:hypothetical protein